MTDHHFKETLMKMEAVSLSFDGNCILRDVNVEVKDIVETGSQNVRGQIVALLGPSGIGKTQMFRIMAGLQEPTAGRVLINQHQEPIKPGLVGVVAQNYPLFMHRTILGNLMVAIKQKLADSEKHQRARAMLKRFELEDKAEAYPAQLSGGQRQRVAIAQQLLCSEHFLLMDEPFSGLDPLMLDTVCRMIAEVANMDELNTIIVVTHDIHAAVTIADTLWLMGRDRDVAGNIIPGARIQKVYDLVELELAWHPDVHLSPRFAAFVNEVKAEFAHL